jgi:hypothetical protein
MKRIVQPLRQMQYQFLPSLESETRHFARGTEGDGYRSAIKVVPRG